MLKKNTTFGQEKISLIFHYLQKKYQTEVFYIPKKKRTKLNEIYGI